MSADTRPRVPYVLPDGTTVRVIHDHGEQPRPVIRYQLRDGSVVDAKLRVPARHWELPESPEVRKQLAAQLTTHLLRDVDELARRYRLLENAQEACLLAAKTGTPTAELLAARRNAEVDLVACVGMVVSSRAMVLHAEQSPSPALPFVPPTPLPPPAEETSDCDVDPEMGARG